MRTVKGQKALLLLLASILAQVLGASVTESVTTETESNEIADNSTVVPIISSEYDSETNGTFHWSFESGDGTKQAQEGEPKQVENKTIEVEKGSFSYVGDDGETYAVEYTADENGFQAHGSHLPTPPPVPPIIARALRFLATLPPSPAPSPAPSSAPSPAPSPTPSPAPNKQDSDTEVS